MEYNHERQKDYQSDIDCKMVDELDKEYFIKVSFVCGSRPYNGGAYTNFKDTMMNRTGEGLGGVGVTIQQSVNKGTCVDCLIPRKKSECEAIWCNQLDE
jgi:hypothetical protein